MLLPTPALLKIWSALTRWLLWGVLVAWVLSAAGWACIHWLIVPRIGELRPHLEAQASRALGVPVRVGAVVARSNGLAPSFELTEVELTDAQGRIALSLPRVVLAVSPRSMWRLGFEQVYIDQPRLDVRRDAAGRIWVAGLDLLGPGPGGGGAQDWFFSQVEFVVRGGAVRWTDEQRSAEAVVFQQIDLVARNLGRHHDLRLDITPPPDWGERFTAQARMLQPLLSRRNGQWQSWDGQGYVEFQRIDLAELNRHTGLSAHVHQGHGALRAWLGVQRGQVLDVTADLAVADLSVTLGPQLQALDFARLQTRLEGRRLLHGFELGTQSLQFDTPDGLRWPGGNARLRLLEATAQQVASGELQADRLDLSALAHIADRLPLLPELRNQLQGLAPQGRVQALSASWQGALGAPSSYRAKGQVSDLAWAAAASWPGLRGLSADFDFDQRGGRASVSVLKGAADLPDLFQQPVIAIDELTAQVSWRINADAVSVEFSRLQFANADAQGQASIKWQTSDPAKSASGSRFPGLLDLQASLTRADGRQVHRYLPLVIDQAARDYVREAVQAGSASNVRFRVKGDLYDMPMALPGQGQFRISADVKNVRLAYVPRSLQAPEELPWPPLVDLSGELVIERQQLLVRAARGQLGDEQPVPVTRVDASIADLTRTQVKVSAEMKGQAGSMLRLVNASPVSGWTQQVLSQAVLQGAADVRLKLSLPIADLSRATVQGSVALAGNELRIHPSTPQMTRARGQVNFTHQAMSLAGVQVRMLGGDARLEGGLLFAAVPDRNAPTLIRANGTVSAEGLRQAQELGWVAALASQFSGSTSYTASLGFQQGVPELQVSSSLVGMASSLPAPLDKDAVSALPMRLQTRVLSDALPGQAAPPLRDRWEVVLGRRLQAAYERDVSGAQPRVLHGSIGVAQDAARAMPAATQGVHVHIDLPRVDADAWSAVLSRVDAVSARAGPGPTTLGSYLPTDLALRTDQLTFGARQFNQLVLGASRDGLLWRANVDAAQLNGYLEYRQSALGGAPGRVHARLARLTLQPSTVSDVETLLDAQPASIPALDIVVDDFELRGKHLGRLEVQAINRAADDGSSGEWRLSKFNLTTPQAELTAFGHWSRLGQGVAASPGAPDLRRTVMNFKLDLQDGGGLLARLGMKDVVRQASGRMEGQVAWQGSPLKVDYPSLSGNVAVNVAAGQFLKADPGLAKLLGVLSLQALPRRLTLDFRDVFSDGFAFDFLRGDVLIEKGLARTNNLQMRGVNAAVLMEGSADLARETQDLKVVVVPELNATTVSLIATVINPAVGLGSFLAQWLLRQPLTESATQVFQVSGSWTDPQVMRVRSDNTNVKEATP